jgi:hypothetical protein
MLIHGAKEKNSRHPAVQAEGKKKSQATYGGHCRFSALRTARRIMPCKGDAGLFFNHLYRQFQTAGIVEKVNPALAGRRAERKRSRLPAMYAQPAIDILSNNAGTPFGMRDKASLMSLQ